MQNYRKGVYQIRSTLAMTRLDAWMRHAIIDMLQAMDQHVPSAGLVQW